jgi:hypothetical protein
VLLTAIAVGRFWIARMLANLCCRERDCRGHLMTVQMRGQTTSRRTPLASKEVFVE